MMLGMVPLLYSARSVISSSVCRSAKGEPLLLHVRAVVVAVRYTPLVLLILVVLIELVLILRRMMILVLLIKVMVLVRVVVVVVVLLLLMLLMVVLLLVALRGEPVTAQIWTQRSGVTDPRSSLLPAPVPTSTSASTQRHPDGVKVISNCGLLHDLQTSVTNQVIQVMSMKDGPLLCYHLVPHRKLKLELLDGQVLPFHHAIVHNSTLFQFHVVQLKLPNPILKFHQLLPVLPRNFR
mmetsp:Transcript_13952/g.28580  ORF Transcript_13952/g.28580 Transcript_13952/m.28580 type:complete len:237 (-) Transcript_13952:1960-2670(-)